MDYDSTAIPAKYDSARQLSYPVMNRWLGVIRRSAPLRPGTWIADVGCGTGRFSAGLAEAYRSHVVGFDRSSRMLTEASALPGRVWFCVSEAEALPLAQASMGMVFLSNVIHHLHDLRFAAAGFAHAVQPGGFVVVRNYVREQLQRLAYLRFFPEALALSVESVSSKAEVRDTFGRAGFELVAYDSIEQPVAESASLYLTKIQSRVYSDLASISDEEFAAGVARMAGAISSGWSPLLTEPVALFSFQRKAAARRCG